MKLLKKADVYSLEKVEERILFYKNKIETLTDQAKIKTNTSLLAFWTIYKHKNYPDGKTSPEI